MPELMRLVDSLDISDDDIVYRRARWVMLGGADSQKDGVDLYPVGSIAPISKNFFNDYPLQAAQDLGFEGPCMSVGLRSVLLDSDVEPNEMLVEYPEDGLLRLSVGELRNLATASGKPTPQGVMLAPTPKDPWHTVVFNLPAPPRSKQAKVAMAELSEWEIPLRR